MTAGPGWAQASGTTPHLPAQFTEPLTLVFLWITFEYIRFHMDSYVFKDNSDVGTAQ